jgi:hypothetical protein
LPSSQVILFKASQSASLLYLKNRLPDYAKSISYRVNFIGMYLHLVMGKDTEDKEQVRLLSQEVSLMIFEDKKSLNEEEKAAADRRSADKVAAEERSVADKRNANKGAAETQAALDRLSADKASAESRAAVDRRNADKVTAETQAALDRLSADKVAAKKS